MAPSLLATLWACGPNNETEFVPLDIHRVSPADPNLMPYGVGSRAHIDGAIDYLNDRFAGTNKVFYLRSLSDIPNDSYYTSQDTDKIIKEYRSSLENRQDGLNIFFSPQSWAADWKNGKKVPEEEGGFYSFGTNWISLATQDITDSEPMGYILTHEIGHAFGLKHNLASVMCTRDGSDYSPHVPEPVICPVRPEAQFTEREKDHLRTTHRYEQNEKDVEALPLQSWQGVGCDTTEAPTSVDLQTAVNNISAGGEVEICQDITSWEGWISISSQDNILIHGTSSNEGNIRLEGEKASLRIDRAEGVTIENLDLVGVPVGLSFTNTNFRHVNFLNNQSTALMALLSSATLQDCIFANNSPEGAISTSGSSPFSISDSFFYENTAQYGGAIRTDGSLWIDNSVFIGNSAAIFGGALYSTPLDSTSSINVTSSYFYGNDALQYGGAICVNGGGALSTTNSTFVNNTASDNGGAVSTFSANYTCNNTEFEHNSSGRYGGAVFVDNALLTGAECFFDENEALAGGAIYLEKDQATNGEVSVLDDFKFTDNTSQYPGSALYVGAGNTLQIDESSFSDSSGFGESTYMVSVAEDASVDFNQTDFSGPQSIVSEGDVSFEECTFSDPTSCWFIEEDTSLRTCPTE